MALLQTRSVALDMRGKVEDHHPMLPSKAPPVAVISDGSVHSMDVDDAIPQVIILIEQFWGYDAEEDDDECSVSSSYMPADFEPTSLPSEATIQVLKAFFDGIEDQMDVEDELLLFRRPQETSSVVSDLSQATVSTTSSSGSFRGWIPSSLFDGDENGNI